MARDFDLGEEVVFFVNGGASGCRSRIVGPDPSAFLLFHLPKGHPIAPALKANDRVLVHSLKFPTCQFSTSVIRILREPSVLFVAYPPPQSIRQLNRRQDERRKVFLPGRCWSLDPHERKFMWEGHVLDLSQSGCLILGDLSQRLMKEVEIVFRVPWTGEVIRARAQVARVEMARRRLMSGLQFRDLEPEAETKISSLLGSLKTEEIARMVIADGDALKG
jgi:c-di-GMP-binding flagellar brake protein YcgR